MRLTIHSGDRECIWLSTESDHGMLTGSVVVFDHHGSFRDYAARLDVTVSQNLVLRRHMEALFDQMYEIKHGLHRMIVDQRFFRSQLHRQRDTIMNTHTRVLQFAAVEAVVLILASALQVLFLRRMFDNSAKRGSGLTGLVNRRKM
ncbi:unnamed protein product [Closterium sp. NIES-54]